MKEKNREVQVILKTVQHFTSRNCKQCKVKLITCDSLNE